MNQTKFRKIAIVALSLVLALVLSLAIGSLAPAKRVLADTFLPSAIFSAGTGGSVGTSEAESGETSYVQISLDDGGKVHFRRDLALKWYEAAKEDASDEGLVGIANKGQRRYFSLGFEFTELNFEEFSLKFESAEENISKDGTSTNSVIFYHEDGEVSVAVKNAHAHSEDKDEWEPEKKIAVDVAGGVKITFDETDCTIGEFAVYVNDTYVGKITNVGGNYMEYLSTASTTPRVPLTFVADKIEGSERLVLLIKELNGQTFEINENGRIEDNAPAVLVLNESIYAYNLGKRWSLTYEAIDVCDSSVTVTRRYAMLKAPDEEGVYTKPVADDYSALTTSTYFMPTSDNGDIAQYVSIYFDLDDGTLSDLTDEEKEARRVYLTWYAADGAIKNWGEDDEEFDYILVNREQGGPSYVGITADEESKKNLKDGIADTLAEEYQLAVNEAAEGLSAGEGAYFYLPSLRGLIESEYTDYRNLRFSVYYRKQSHAVGSSASSATSLRYNALRFEVDEEGKYLFKVLANDASSNAMKYYYEGRLVDVNSNNIWDIDEIPSFSFEATYTGATIEDPGTQSIGYRDSTYSISSFDIVALSGYETEYTLFCFDTSKLPEGTRVPSLSELTDNSKSYFKQFEQYMTEIKPYNINVTEDDEERWERTDNKYHWNPDSSLSFVPQETAYYFVRLVVTESRMPGYSATAYQVIEVKNAIDPLPEPFYWLENNVTSVVLFSISAVLLIAIIVLLVVKPSEKKVEEIDLESLKGNRKNNKE